MQNSALIRTAVQAQNQRCCSWLSTERPLPKDQLARCGILAPVPLAGVEATGLVERRATDSSMPTQESIPSFEPLLGKGWFNLEAQDHAQWFWSRDRAELRIPDHAGEIQLRFFSQYTRLTGKPQQIRASVDDKLVTEQSFEGDGDLRIPCGGGRTIQLEIDAIRPCHFPGHSDTRVLGIGVYSVSTGALTGSAAQTQAALSPAPDRSAAATTNRPPLTLQLEVTTACHLKCVMCSRSSGTGGATQHMSDETWRRFFALARHVEYVNILGTGEPWMHPRFLDFLQQLDDAGVGTVIVTSGDLVTEKRAEALGRLRHLRKISFSIDSPEPAAYARIRGQSLERALAGLQRTMSHLPDPSKVRISATVMRDNLFSLAGFPELLRRYGVRQLSLRGVNNTKETTRSMMPDYTELERSVLKQIKREAEADGALVNFLPTLPADLIQIASGDFLEESLSSQLAAPAPLPGARGARTRICSDPWEKAIVTKDGAVYPCECYHLQVPIGSLANDSFDEIWYGERYDGFRRTLLCGGNVGCRNCERRDEGQHPLNRFSAEVVEVSLAIGGVSRIQLRNTGLGTWGAGSSVRLATSRPRDRADSIYRHDSWISPARLCSHEEQTVEPGSVGSFRFRTTLAPTATISREYFQFVSEGECWLPNTEFSIGGD